MCQAVPGTQKHNARVHELELVANQMGQGYKQTVPSPLPR